MAAIPAFGRAAARGVPARGGGVRALWRQREALVRHSSWHIQHMHKALDQMNLQIRISGGKLLGSATRPSATRVAKALRMAAQGLHHANNELGQSYRRMRARLGGAAAITATAHKLARSIYAMLRTGRPYRPEPHGAMSTVNRERTLQRLKANAKSLGFGLVELQPAGEVT